MKMMIDVMGRVDLCYFVEDEQFFYLDVSLLTHIHVRTTV